MSALLLLVAVVVVVVIAAVGGSGGDSYEDPWGPYGAPWYKVGNLIFRVINKRMRLCPPHKKLPAGQRAGRPRFSQCPQCRSGPSTHFPSFLPASERELCGPRFNLRGPHA